MASPQKENGFAPLANEILEALSRVKMSGTEWQYLMCLFRKTYGFQKKEDWITNSQVVEITGLKKERVSEAKSRLLERKIVTEKRNKISFQKDYDLWVELRKSVTKVVTEKRNAVTEKRNNCYGKAYTQKKKDNITKDTSEQGSQDNNSSMKNLIPEVIKLFESVDPKNKNYYKNKTQREACSFLLTEYGFEEVSARIAVLPKTNSMKYFPTITTPCQLRDKWVQLETAVQRIKSKDNSVAF